MQLQEKEASTTVTGGGAQVGGGLVRRVVLSLGGSLSREEGEEGCESQGGPGPAPVENESVERKKKDTGQSGRRREETAASEDRTKRIE